MGREWGIDGRPLRVAAFRRLWVAGLVTAVGGSFGVVAVPAYLFSATGASVAIGVSGLVLFAALLVSALVAGVLADAVDRRWLLLVGNTALGVTYVGFGACVAGGVTSLPVLLGLVAGQGLSYGTILTVSGAVVPRVVPPELLAAAGSLSSLVRYGGAVTGPLLAGVLIPFTGLAGLFFLDAVALLAVLLAVARLPALPPVRREERQRGGAAGFRHLARDRLLVAVLGVDLAAMVFGMPTALFPELARETYGGSPDGGPELGLLYAAYPLGVCAMALVSGSFTRARRPGALMAAAAAAWGVAVVVLGLAGHLAVATVALAVGGAANLVLSSFRTAITQARIPDDLRGRTQGALTVILVGGPQLATVLHGLGGAVAGARTTIVAGGLLTVATVAAIARAFPELGAEEGRAAVHVTTRMPGGGG